LIVVFFSTQFTYALSSFIKSFLSFVGLLFTLHLNSPLNRGLPDLLPRLLLLDLRGDLLLERDLRGERLLDFLPDLRGDLLLERLPDLRGDLLLERDLRGLRLAILYLNKRKKKFINFYRKLIIKWIIKS
jgi:hypothetical protein